MSKFGFRMYGSPDGARTILSTIAGSMIAVAATTFSITMVAVTSAANQYGPRLIGNFMRDKGNQWVLGTFTATFLYSLLVLRAVRDGHSILHGDPFIPGVSVSIALGLTVLAVGVLIYFIHHVPETLNVGNLTAKVGREMKAQIEQVYAKGKNASDDKMALNVNQVCKGKKAIICAINEGFIQTLDIPSLVKAAKTVQGVVEVKKKPGSFVTEGDILAYVWDAKNWVEEHEAEFTPAYATGSDRTSHQNLMFLADELVEILARAVSPGINDPYTAINCVHWLKSGLKAFEKTQQPTPFSRDETGNVRVVWERMTFEEFFSTVMERVLPYVFMDENVCRALIDCLKDLLANATQPSNKLVIRSAIENIEKCRALSATGVGSQTGLSQQA